jgi:Lipopolysaccharide assembly protein A domain
MTATPLLSPGAPWNGKVPLCRSSPPRRPHPGGTLTLFGAQNQNRVALHFLWFSSRALTASFAILATLLGVLIGVLLMLPGRIVIRHTARGLRRDLARRDEQMARVSASTPTAEIVRTVEIADGPPGRPPIGWVVGSHPSQQAERGTSMGKEPKRTAAGDDRKPGRAMSASAPHDPKRTDEQSDAASGVPRETYAEAVEQAVKDVHG